MQYILGKVKYADILTNYRLLFNRQLETAPYYLPSSEFYNPRYSIESLLLALNGRSNNDLTHALEMMVANPLLDYENIRHLPMSMLSTMSWYYSNINAVAYTPDNFYKYNAINNRWYAMQFITMEYYDDIYCEAVKLQLQPCCTKYTVIIGNITNIVNISDTPFHVEKWGEYSPDRVYNQMAILRLRWGVKTDIKFEF